MKLGLVFVSTGGNKMVRALRSLRIGEPSLPVHIILVTSTRSWEKSRDAVPASYFESQQNVTVRQISTGAYINGSFNEAMKWMKELGYTHACSIHDDVIFSPLPENASHLSEWFTRIEQEPDLQQASGLTLSFMEALVDTGRVGVWERSPEDWDSRDLESVLLWSRLCPAGKPAMYFGSEGASEGIQVPLILTEQNVKSDLQVSDWFVKYFCTETICPMARLGPCGQVVPIEVWEQVGGFSEDDGVFYDMEYPVACALKGFPPVKVIPNTPYIHLHNQSTAFGDPAVGLWGNDLQSFIRKYGKHPSDILRELPNGGGY